MNIFKVRGSRYLNLFGHMLHFGDLCACPSEECLSLRAIKHRLCKTPSPALFIGFLRCVKHLTSPSCLYEPVPSWRPPDWIGARPGSPSLGVTWDRGEGQVRAEAGLARAPTRAPFLQMDLEPFIARSLPGCCHSSWPEKSRARLGFPMDFITSFSYGFSISWMAPTIRD